MVHLYNYQITCTCITCIPGMDFLVVWTLPNNKLIFAYHFPSSYNKIINFNKMLSFLYQIKKIS